MNFNDFGYEPPAGGGGGRQPGNFTLTRQPSIYSLTFDELQTTIGGPGKDFGSMNMDELLKSIWSAEETQNTGTTASAGQGQLGTVSGGQMQRQGSLTLPRTLSQKTVDEVWKDMSKEFGGTKDSISIAEPNHSQRHQTLGEITLEEFLVRAGVVREDTQLTGVPNNGGIFGDLSVSLNNPRLGGIDFQQSGQNQNSVTAQMGSRITEDSNQLAIQSANSPLDIARTTQKQIHSPFFPNHNLVQSAALQGGGMGMVVSAGSPSVSSDGHGKSNGDTSSVSPVPYVFNGGIRGRRSSTLEKVVERRQRRMIKNRESAARSRARKQAYTMELEAEVAKLKEENEELRKKQAEIMELRKSQVMEMVKEPGAKRRCLRRTQTGPW